jgi:hypothetical protein
VYYDPFTGTPLEYEMYDLRRDPLEMTNLAHAANLTPESEVRRARLHARLAEVMKDNGTTPDEVRWPSVEEFRPSAAAVVSGEDEELASV